MRRRPRIVGVENHLRGLLGQPQLVPATGTVVTLEPAYETDIAMPLVFRLSPEQRTWLARGIAFVAGLGGQDIGGRVGEEVASVVGLEDSVVISIAGGIGRAAAVAGALWLYRWLRRLLRI